MERFHIVVGFNSCRELEKGNYQAGTHLFNRQKPEEDAWPGWRLI